MLPNGQVFNFKKEKHICEILYDTTECVCLLETLFFNNIVYGNNPSEIFDKSYISLIFS